MPMPYELRSPEDIAKEYGGNKQKIGAAVQAGLLDPTAGVLAGMFIDRMRNAVAEEQAPTTTVAQDTMSPRPAPAPGAGAVPAGLAAMQPQAAPMQPTPAPGAGAVQMARGGLAGLNVPDTMYDYAGGGIIAFAEGDAVEDRLRLLPVDNLADAYVFLQERGAEIPEDMSESAIINYANRVREMENMEIRDSGVRARSVEAPPSETPFGALLRDYGSGGRGDVVPETRLDAAPQAPMGGGEYAPGFAPTGPVQRGLMPPKAAPEGSSPERAVPFLGQLMEAITPTAEASGFRNGAPVVTPEVARAELAEIAPDWYDANLRSDAQVVKDLADFKEGTYRSKLETVVAEEPYDVDEIEEAGITALRSNDLQIARDWLKNNAPDWYDMSKRSESQVLADYQDFLKGTYRPKEEAKTIDEIEEAGLTALGSRTLPDATRTKPYSDIDAETQRRLDDLFKDPEYQNMLMPGLKGVQERYNLADQLEEQGLLKRAELERADAEEGLAQLKMLPVYNRLEMVSPQARVDEKLRQANDPNMLGITNIWGTSPEDAARLAAEARTEQEKIDALSGVPFGSVQMDEIQRMFPTMATSPAPSAAADQADFLNQNLLAKGVESYSLSPKMPTPTEMGFGAAEIPETPEAPAAVTTPPAPGAVSNPKLAGLFGDDKAKNMALLELGARLMSGQSPYALQNLGTAATGTIGSLREQEKAASDRLLKERMLQIEEDKAKKEKDTDERNRLRILESGTPKEREALKQLMDQEQSVAMSRLGVTGERYEVQGRTEAVKLANQDPDIITAKLAAMKDPSKRAEYNQLLEERVAQILGRGKLGALDLGAGTSSNQYSGWGQLQ